MICENCNDTGFVGDSTCPKCVRLIPLRDEQPPTTNPKSIPPELVSAEAVARAAADEIALRGFEEKYAAVILKHIRPLIEERDRLKAIIDTHDLCHNLHGKVGVREFADGCADEQRKIYGCAPDEDECIRLQAELAAAKQTIAELERQVKHLGDPVVDERNSMEPEDYKSGEKS